MNISVVILYSCCSSYEYLFCSPITYSCCLQYIPEPTCPEQSFNSLPNEKYFRQSCFLSLYFNFKIIISRHEGRDISLLIHIPVVLLFSHIIFLLSAIHPWSNLSWAKFQFFTKWEIFSAKLLPLSLLQLLRLLSADMRGETSLS